MSATTRLTFLYPQLLRTVRRTAQPQIKSSIGWTSRRHKSSFPPRVGKAVAPTTWEQEQQKDPEQNQQQTRQTPESAEPQQPAVQDAATSNEGPTDSVAAPEPETFVTEVKAAAEQLPAKMEEQAKLSKTRPIEETTATPTAEQSAESTAEDGTKKKSTPEEEKVRQSREEAKSSGPLEAVMLMQPPEHVAKQHPSLSPSRYVHHFDSYSLVKQLEEGGYTRDQAVTSMKAIRKLLAVNLDVAQESLVSKSDVENETYLFTAACSELATEIRNNRRLSDEHTRQERTHVQHDVDILTQTLNQELLTLNDNVRGMFNDRKMAAREEQNTVDSAVQKLNYKISIVLTSDAKSEIESVRWTLIRRSVLGIIFMAMLTLGTLRYATYVGQQRKLEAARKKKEEEEARKGPAKREPVDGPDAAEILAAN